ncbi:uncharacterized protein N7482_006765 [Penicillium canariense]|uniref:Uncharacterized protein n=1 Tax=Penicillium canariense TaxID=189055 RepID=A0A9W9HXU2_9EURO|nr:uncharacterized protein N7482_006765 [Penicillium canariense]KAJ5159761.1 hypothetical protein N7482_006765 [Penicillium canariense]
MFLWRAVKLPSRGWTSSNRFHQYPSRFLSSSSSLAPKGSKQAPKNTDVEPPSAPNKKDPAPNDPKTVAQADTELRERLERMSGEGGAAGIEYEDGKPSAMKRGVRNNMFRLI